MLFRKNGAAYAFTSEMENISDFWTQEIMHVQQVCMHIPIIIAVELNSFMTMFSFLLELPTDWVGISITHIAYLVNR